MNINAIKEIVNNELINDSLKPDLIINVLASDKDAIPMLLKVLNKERQDKNELIDEMNLELSRADVHIQCPTLAAGNAKKEEDKLRQAKEYVLNHITAFYVKHKGRVTHCFNKQV